jgi:hypothetical protein
MKILVYVEEFKILNSYDDHMNLIFLKILIKDYPLNYIVWDCILFQFWNKNEIFNEFRLHKYTNSDGQI